MKKLSWASFILKLENLVWNWQKFNGLIDFEFSLMFLELFKFNYWISNQQKNLKLFESQSWERLTDFQNLTILCDGIYKVF